MTLLAHVSGLPVEELFPLLGMTATLLAGVRLAIARTVRQP